MVDLNIVVAVVGVGGTLAGFVFGFLGNQRALKQDNIKSGELYSDIIHIKRGIDDLVRKQETTDCRYLDIVRQIACVETRLDNLEKG